MTIKVIDVDIVNSHLDLISAVAAQKKSSVFPQDCNSLVKNCYASAKL